MKSTTKNRKPSEAPRLGRNLFPKGTAVRVVNHRGSGGSTGRVSRAKPEWLRDDDGRYRWFWMVRLTGGKAAGWTIRFSARELERA